MRSRHATGACARAGRTVGRAALRPRQRPAQQGFLCKLGQRRRRGCNQIRPRAHQASRYPRRDRSLPRPDLRRALLDVARLLEGRVWGHAARHRIRSVWQHRGAGEEDSHQGLRGFHRRAGAGRRWRSRVAARLSEERRGALPPIRHTVRARRGPDRILPDRPVFGRAPYRRRSRYRCSCQSHQRRSRALRCGADVQLRLQIGL